MYIFLMTLLLCVAPTACMEQDDLIHSFYCVDPYDIDRAPVFDLDPLTALTDMIHSLKTRGEQAALQVDDFGEIMSVREGQIGTYVLVSSVDVQEKINDIARKLSKTSLSDPSGKQRYEQLRQQKEFYTRLATFCQQNTNEQKVKVEATSLVSWLLEPLRRLFGASSATQDPENTSVPNGDQIAEAYQAIEQLIAQRMNDLCPNSATQADMLKRLGELRDVCGHLYDTLKKSRTQFYGLHARVVKPDSSLKTYLAGTYQDLQKCGGDITKVPQQFGLGDQKPVDLEQKLVDERWQYIGKLQEKGQLDPEQFYLHRQHSYVLQDEIARENLQAFVDDTCDKLEVLQRTVEQAGVTSEFVQSLVHELGFAQQLADSVRKQLNDKIKRLRSD